MPSACRVDARSVQDALLDSKSDQVSLRDWHGQYCVTSGVAVAPSGPGCRNIVWCILPGFFRIRRFSLASKHGQIEIGRVADARRAAIKPLRIPGRTQHGSVGVV